MKEFTGKTTILWDFDGVILDSMEVREEGFKQVLSKYPAEELNELLDYHRENGGLSRYAKFRYFFEKIRGESPNNEKVRQLSSEFSELMRKLLLSKERLVREVIHFISKNYLHYNMHIISGSDGEELRYLCGQLGISKYFLSIHGSPTPKVMLVKQLLEEKKYEPEKTCLIGDTINDYEAAKSNDVAFYGYNNWGLREKGLNYINSFE